MRYLLRIDTLDHGFPRKSEYELAKCWEDLVKIALEDIADALSCGDTITGGRYTTWDKAAQTQILFYVTEGESTKQRYVSEQWRPSIREWNIDEIRIPKWAALCSDGIPADPRVINGKEVIAFDNGGKTTDRYTILIEADHEKYDTWYMSENPDSPLGVHTYAGKVWLINYVQEHDEERISFDTLPETVKEAAEENTKW